MRRIIDTRYEKADLNKFMTEKCQYLSPSEQESLLNILKIFEDFFGFSLGTWNTDPVDMGFKNDSKPVCLRSYSEPQLHGDMFRK